MSYSAIMIGEVDRWKILGLNGRIWCYGGGELSLDGARFQLRDWLRLQRRLSVSEGVSEWVSGDKYLSATASEWDLFSLLLHPWMNLTWYRSSCFLKNDTVLVHRDEQSLVPSYPQSAPPCVQLKKVQTMMYYKYLRHFYSNGTEFCSSQLSSHSC